MEGCLKHQETWELTPFGTPSGNFDLIVGGTVVLQAVIETDIVKTKYVFWGRGGELDKGFVRMQDFKLSRNSQVIPKCDNEPAD